eukprot:TRINITY_DN3954_c0_g1_i18.p2 TRINITY_DN3954_c0_g1~~TRINITY_DN3954_c0_g1_i18.p2  ORF type:complete len:393 (-),score=56.60 TRINITY_DN3954_c0_g1_i18:244-1422(-)
MAKHTALELWSMNATEIKSIFTSHFITASHRPQMKTQGMAEMIHKLLIDYGDAFEQQWHQSYVNYLKSNSWHSSPNRVQAFSKDPKCCPIRNDDQSCDVIVTPLATPLSPVNLSRSLASPRSVCQPIERNSIATDRAPPPPQLNVATASNIAIPSPPQLNVAIPSPPQLNVDTASDAESQSVDVIEVAQSKKRLLQNEDEPDAVASNGIDVYEKRTRRRKTAFESPWAKLPPLEAQAKMLHIAHSIVHGMLKDSASATLRDLLEEQFIAVMLCMEFGTGDVVGAKAWRILSSIYGLNALRRKRKDKNYESRLHLMGKALFKILPIHHYRECWTAWAGNLKNQHSQINVYKLDLEIPLFHGWNPWGNTQDNLLPHSVMTYMEELLPPIQKIFE